MDVMGGAETPLVPMRPVPLQAPASQRQISAAPSPINPDKHPSVFILRGFTNQALDEAYTANSEISVGGRPTYWNSGGNHLVYFQKEEFRWVITPRYNDHGRTDLLDNVRRGEMRGIAFEDDAAGDVWQEFSNGVWQAVSVQFAKLVPESSSPQQASTPVLPYSSGASSSSAQPNRPTVGQVTTVVSSGFRSGHLNTTYHVDRSIPIGGRSTYWDGDRNYFIYYQASCKRWAISCRRAGGEDMLLDAQRGGIRGLAYEVQKGAPQWREYFADDWITVEPHIQRLSPKGIVPQHGPQHGALVVPQPKQQAEVVTIKLEDSTPIPLQHFTSEAAAVPSMPPAAEVEAPPSPPAAVADSNDLHNADAQRLEVGTLEAETEVVSEEEHGPESQAKGNKLDTPETQVKGGHEDGSRDSAEIRVKDAPADGKVDVANEEKAEEKHEKKDKKDKKEKKEDKKDKKDKRRRREKELEQRLRSELLREMQEARLGVAAAPARKRGTQSGKAAEAQVRTQRTHDDAVGKVRKGLGGITPARRLAITASPGKRRGTKQADAAQVKPRRNLAKRRHSKGSEANPAALLAVEDAERPEGLGGTSHCLRPPQRRKCWRADRFTLTGKDVPL